MPDTKKCHYGKVSGVPVLGTLYLVDNETGDYITNEGNTTARLVLARILEDEEEAKTFAEAIGYEIVGQVPK